MHFNVTKNSKKQDKKAAQVHEARMYLKVCIQKQAQYSVSYFKLKRVS